MVRLTLLLLLLLPALSAQTATDTQFAQAGVCARCHVISVVEWGVSKHSRGGTNCVACHGVSQGHVVDERNNVKPEQLPHQAAIAGLCATCHAAGCPKTQKKENCQTCHHVHALLDPAKAPSSTDAGLAALTQRWKSAEGPGPRREGSRGTVIGNWLGANIWLHFRRSPATESQNVASRLVSATFIPDFRVSQ